MTESDIITYFSELPSHSQDVLINDLLLVKNTADFDLLRIREKQLNDKRGNCPHCSAKKYKKDGKEKSGVQRYKCNSCNRNFNPYTGTWLAKINKKELLIPYIKLMEQGLSLDKIKDKLEINKKTAFDWRHKICRSLDTVEESMFSGITESDETFFLHSKKGEKKIERKVRKRGGRSSKKGINDEQVAAIVTVDRDNAVDLKVACFGRITKKDITQAIGSRIDKETILCSDGHVSYKGFAKDNNIEHHVLRANIKQYVTDKVYHIQHVNSAHSRLKGWINTTLHGVATKYLQSYLNWFRFTEKFKNMDFMKNIMKSVLDTKANMKFNNITQDYSILLKTAQKI